MSRLLALFALAFFSSVTWAQSLLVSTQPLYLIAKEITKNVEQPVLLLKDQTGHDISLTPAHRKAIQEADLVIWLGKAHEAPLDGLLSEQSKAIAILNTGVVNLLPQRNTRGVALADTVDTHVWLDPNNAVRIGFFIAALRSQQYPEHKDTYWSNAKAFAHELLVLSQRYGQNKVAYPYWSFHDAYQYLERPLNLKFYGALTSDPHVAPTVAQIKYLNDQRPSKNMCLLAEGHASANQYKKLNPLVFKEVDESMSRAGDFISGWKQLADMSQHCAKSAQK